MRPMRRTLTLALLLAALAVFSLTLPQQDALAQSAHKLAEVMYAQAQQAAGGEGGGDGGKEKVVDAEFEEVDKDKK